MRTRSILTLTSLLKLKNASKLFCTLREENTRLGVGVWWDYKSCKLPESTLNFNLYERIKGTLRANGINGAIHHVKAYADMAQIPKAQQHALLSSYIGLYHVPGEMGIEDDEIMSHLQFWTGENPPPKHILVISGDEVFSPLLHHLRMINYNVSLVVPRFATAPTVLLSAATIVWEWSSLLEGENLVGRRVNQPPPYPYGYGPDKHY